MIHTCANSEQVFEYRTHGRIAILYPAAGEHACALSGPVAASVFSARRHTLSKPCGTPSSSDMSASSAGNRRLPASARAE
jgi:hypothetical protein